MIAIVITLAVITCYLGYDYYKYSRRSKGKIERKDILYQAIVIFVIVAAGCFIPVERTYIREDGTPSVDSSVYYDTIEKFAVFEVFFNPESASTYAAKTNIIRFSNGGKCDSSHACSAYHYFSNTKQLEKNLYSGKASVSFSDHLDYSAAANVHEYANMRCFVYGLFCSYRGGPYPKETVNHYDIIIDKNAIVKEYSTVNDCTDSDKTIDTELEGDYSHCTKDWTKYNAIKASSLF